jgi:hypothetical protein
VPAFCHVGNAMWLPVDAARTFLRLRWGDSP